MKDLRRKYGIVDSSSSSPSASSSSPAGSLEHLVRETPGLIAELELDRVLQQVAHLAAALLNAKYAAVGLLNPDNRTLKSFTTSGIGPEERERMGKHPTGRGILGLVIREGKIVRLPDLTQHPAAVGFPPNHPPMQSFLGVPIMGRRGVLGDLYLTEKIGAPVFSDEDEHVAILLSTIIGSAVENAISHQQTARLLEEVQQLHRSRERFFAMVNHELRNSLAAVYGWAEMLVRKKDPQTVPRGAFEIVEAAEQAIALINDLLDLNRLDEDRLKPVMQDVDCGSLIQASVQRVTPAALEKKVSFALPDAGRVLVCRTDAHRAEQILVNLFSNAIKHAPPGSQVTVSVDEVGAMAIIKVEDQGAGLVEEDVDRVFDIFYTTGDQHRLSHGIGLPLSRRLARLLGGDLKAVAQAGKGGLFMLEIPLAQDIKRTS